MITSLKCLDNYLLHKLSLVYIRNISVSSSRNLIQKWREERGLPMNPNAHGILTDGQDYSFLDNRPTPYGTGQMKRISKQRQLTDTIMKLTKEVDFAVERYDQIKKNETEERERIKRSKLKPKGVALLNKNN